MTDEITEQYRFPCEQCGSELRFDPSALMLACDHCANTQPIGDASPWSGHAIKELDFRKAADASLPEADADQIRVANCPNCGATVEFDPDQHAAECPFCATPVVTDTGVHRQLKPRAVLPFALGEREARKAMTDWLGRLWFAPGALQEYARAGRAMQGIYVPYWTFDADTRTAYTGQRGTVYHESHPVTVTVNGKSRTQMRRVAKVRWRAVNGRVARFFDDVLVLASRSLPKRYTDGLQPWDLSALEPYRPEYLAGFRAEAYTVSLEDGYTEAREIMNRIIARDVRFDIGGDRQRIDSMETEVGKLTFKHILLPVWLAAYKYGGKTYRFVVNGRTGAVQGERPWSAWKIALAAIGALAAAAVLGFVFANSR
ncbi:MAG: primosomal protein N' (replication factor Y) - superfamily II helicase [Paracoccaceae bacterium]